jgi:hypothetical protein
VQTKLTVDILFQKGFLIFLFFKIQQISALLQKALMRQTFETDLSTNETKPTFATKPKFSKN